MSNYIVMRTVPGLQMMRVDVDNRKNFELDCMIMASTGTRIPCGVETHRPQTLRARVWRWMLGG